MFLKLTLQMHRYPLILILANTEVTDSVEEVIQFPHEK